MKAIFFVVGQNHAMYVCAVRVAFEESAFTLKLAHTLTYLWLVDTQTRICVRVRGKDGDSTGNGGAERLRNSFTHSVIHLLTKFTF